MAEFHRDRTQYWNGIRIDGTTCCGPPPSRNGGRRRLGGRGAGFAQSLSAFPDLSIVGRQERGDETFALKFGLKGVKLGFVAFYISGLLLLSLSFFITGLKPLAAALLVLGLAWGFGIGFRLRPLQGKESEYGSVMRLKYTTSAIFVFLLVGAIAWKHGALL